MLLFKRCFIEDILTGRKTQTRRMHKKNIRKAGSIQACKSDMLGEPFCKVLITRVFSQMLCDISEADARKEGFVDKEEFLKFVNMDFKRLGSGVVTVYEFRVIPETEGLTVDTC